MQRLEPPSGRYRGAGEVETPAEAMMPELRLVLLFVAALALMGCPGPNYAPYDHMNNNSTG